jgi:hypothetical protein
MCLFEHEGPLVKNRLPGIYEKPCYPADCPNFRLGACRVVMYLYFLMPECSDSLYYIETMSPVSIRNITCFHRKLQEYKKLSRDISIYLQLKKDRDAFLARSIFSLNLSLSVIQKNVFSVPWVNPETTIIIPNPGQNPPDDFYPTYFDTNGKTIYSQNDENELLDKWYRLKNKINHFGIEGSQISQWFLKRYHLDVNVTDFDPPRPPSIFTLAMLNDLLNSIECHAVT